MHKLTGRLRKLLLLSTLHGGWNRVSNSIFQTTDWTEGSIKLLPPQDPVCFVDGSKNRRGVGATVWSEQSRNEEFYILDSDVFVPSRSVRNLCLRETGRKGEMQWQAYLHLLGHLCSFDDSWADHHLFKTCERLQNGTERNGIPQQRCFGYQLPVVYVTTKRLINWLE